MFWLLAIQYIQYIFQKQRHLTVWFNSVVATICLKIKISRRLIQIAMIVKFQKALWGGFIGTVARSLFMMLTLVMQGSVTRYIINGIVVSMVVKEVA